MQRLQDGQSDSKDTEVVRAVITLGQALGKTVIAEGIETPAQLAQLRNLGCEFGQGYLLARPLTPEMAAATALVDLRRADAGNPPLPAPGQIDTGQAGTGPQRRRLRDPASPTLALH